MGGWDWINLAKYRDKWRAAMNTVMNSHVSRFVGNFLPRFGFLKVNEQGCGLCCYLVLFLSEVFVVPFG